jgi:hypothetical protein
MVGSPSSKRMRKRKKRMKRTEIYHVLWTVQR